MCRHERVTAKVRREAEGDPGWAWERRRSLVPNPIDLCLRFWDWGGSLRRVVEPAWVDLMPYLGRRFANVIYFATIANCASKYTSTIEQNTRPTNASLSIN
jgi:hypothetical protein